jgi:hypothetical protein
VERLGKGNEFLEESIQRSASQELQQGEETVMFVAVKRKVL